MDEIFNLTGMTTEEAIRLFAVVTILVTSYVVWSSRSSIASFVKSGLNSSRKNKELELETKRNETEIESRQDSLSIDALSFLDEIARENIQEAVKSSKECQEQVSVLNQKSNESIIKQIELNNKVDLRDKEIEIIKTQLQQTNEILKLTQTSAQETKSSLKDFSEKFEILQKELQIIRAQHMQLKEQLRDEQQKRFDVENELIEEKLLSAKKDAIIKELREDAEERQKESNKFLMYLVNRGITVPLPDAKVFEQLGDVIETMDKTEPVDTIKTEPVDTVKTEPVNAIKTESIDTVEVKLEKLEIKTEEDNDTK